MPLRRIHNHLCTHPHPTKWNHRAFLPASREYFSHFCWYAYLEWLGMDEQLQYRVDVSLKDALTVHTAIAATCVSAFWTGRLILASVNAQNHYPNMPSQSTPGITLVVKTTWCGAWIESKMCTLSDISLQWLQTTKGPYSSLQASVLLKCLSAKKYSLPSSSRVAVLAAVNDLWPLCRGAFVEIKSITKKNPVVHPQFAATISRACCYLHL